MVSAIARVATRRPVAHHGDAVGDAEDLVEAVADIDHAAAALLEPVEHGEEARDLGLRQAGGRLVQHHHPGIGGERACDRDDRLVGAREIGDAGCRIDRAADQGERALGLCRDATPADQAAAAGIAGGQGDVLGDRHRLDEGEILVDESDR